MAAVPAAVDGAVNHAVVAVLRLFGDVERIRLFHASSIHELGVFERLALLNIHALDRIICSRTALRLRLHRMARVVSTTVIGVALHCLGVWGNSANRVNPLRCGDCCIVGESSQALRVVQHLVMLTVVAVYSLAELGTCSLIGGTFLNNDSSDGLHLVVISRRVVSLRRGEPTLLLKQGTQFLVRTTT